MPACFKYTEASKACVRQNQFKCLFRKKTNPQHPRLCSEEREVWSRDKSCHQISIYWFKEITWVKQWRYKIPNVCTKSSRDSLFPAKVTPINHRRNIPHYPGSFAYYFNLFWEIEASTTHKPWHVFPSPEYPFLHLQAYGPLVLVHWALTSQTGREAVHSSTSE